MKIKKIIFTIFMVILLAISFRFLFKDSFLFLKTFFVSPTTIGAVIPSSTFLAKSITKYIKVNKNPIRILEVGAGTGIITEEILKKLRQEDFLDVIELDQKFCSILDAKFDNNKNIKINCLSILDWSPSYKYDFIISGLPFNAFDSDFVENVLSRYRKLIKPGGIISYFEYIALAKIKLFFLSGPEKNNFSKTLTTTTSFRREFEFERDHVVANMPPACVYHLLVE